MKKFFNTISMNVVSLFKSFLKLFDKPLNYITKKLKTNKNTFLTYIITLLCIYFAVDRLFEIGIIIITGVGIKYWSLLKYIFVLSLPFFGYMLAIESKISIQKDKNIKIFNVFSGFFALFLTSALVQYSNEFLWNVFFSAPKYENIIIEDYSIIKRAFIALAIYITYSLLYKCFQIYQNNFDSNIETKRNIINASGYSLDGNKIISGSYSLDSYLGKDLSNKSDVIISQESRFQNTLILGLNLQKKEDNFIDSMILRDIKKKRFLKEVSKNIAFNLLKSKKAVIKMPKSNDYLNENMSLEILKPTKGNEKLFEYCTKNLKLDDNTYKDIGITYLTSNKKSLDLVISAIKKFQFSYTLFDLKENIIGLNPFANITNLNSSENVADIIYHISVLKNMQMPLEEEAKTLLKNIAIVLSETYPKTHDGLLPNYEDMYNLLNNLELLNVLVGQFKSDSDNVLKYTDIINYFDNEIFVSETSKQRVKNLVKEPMDLIKIILDDKLLNELLCNRDERENINVKKHLKNADILLFHVDDNYPQSNLIKIIILNTYNYALKDRDLESKDDMPAIIYLPNFGRYIGDNMISMFNSFSDNVGVVTSSITLNQIVTTTTKERVLNTFKNLIITNDATDEDITEFKTAFNLSDKSDAIPNNIKLSNDYIGIYKIAESNYYNYGFLNIADDKKELNDDYKIEEYDFENLKD